MDMLKFIFKVAIVIFMVLLILGIIGFVIFSIYASGPAGKDIANSIKVYLFGGTGINTDINNITDISSVTVADAGDIVYNTVS